MLERERERERESPYAFLFAPEIMLFYISYLILTIKHLATKVFPLNK
jgi:hypothetical protein